MEGIELRKAVLEAAGWEIRKDYGPYQVWAAYMPNGQVYFVEFSEARVLESCPAVESSVDKALEWLTLDENHYWGFVQAGIWVITLHGQYGANTYLIRSESLSGGMCRAYLKLKSANL